VLASAVVVIDPAIVAVMKSFVANRICCYPLCHISVEFDLMSAQVRLGLCVTWD
jgi:hypothetical protein